MACADCCGYAGGLRANPSGCPSCGPDYSEEEEYWARVEAEAMGPVYCVRCDAEVDPLSEDAYCVACLHELECPVEVEL